MNVFVIDTNVLIVANGRATPNADKKCQLACIEMLEQIKNNRIVAIDSIGLIFEEYGNKLSYSGQPGLGDQFFKYLHDNQGYPKKCMQVEITPKNGNTDDFEEFPSSPELNGFDKSDKKFVAVAAASGETPPILNATDTDWDNYHEALKNEDIVVLQICPQHAKKSS